MADWHSKYQASRAEVASLNSQLTSAQLTQSSSALSNANNHQTEGGIQGQTNAAAIAVARQLQMVAELERDQWRRDVDDLNEVVRTHDLAMATACAELATVRLSR